MLLGFASHKKFGRDAESDVADRLRKFPPSRPRNRLPPDWLPAAANARHFATGSAAVRRAAAADDLPAAAVSTDADAVSHAAQHTRTAAGG